MVGGKSGKIEEAARTGEKHAAESNRNDSFVESKLERRRRTEEDANVGNHAVPVGIMKKM